MTVVRDPKLIGSAPGTQQSLRIASAEGELSAIRRNRAPSGSSAAGGSLVGDATITVKGKLKLAGHLAGTADVPTLSTTAAPQTARFGLGTAAHADDALTIGAFAGFKGINDDQGSNLLGYHGVVPTPPNTAPQGRWHLSVGTAGSGTTTEEPGLAVHRSQNVTTPVRTPADNQYHSAITGICRGDAGDKTMVTGVVGAAHQFSTTATSEADACGVWAFGDHHGIGGGFAIYAEGRISGTSGTPGVGARCRGIEVRTSNFETVPTDSPYVAASITNNKMDAIQMTTLVANDNTKLAGSGLLFYRPTSTDYAQYDVGIACTEGNSPIRNAFLRDDGGSLYSYLVNGTHSTAAIAIAGSAGKFLCGVTSSGFSTKALIRSGADGDAALIVQPLGASPTAGPFQVLSSAGAEWFSISTASHTRILGNLHIEATGGGGAIRFLEQSSPPSTPSAGRVYMYAEASGATSIIKLKDDAGVVTTLGSGGGVLTAPITVLGPWATDGGHAARFGDSGGISGKGVVEIKAERSEQRSGQVIDATNVSEIVITTTSSLTTPTPCDHGLTTGDHVTITGVGGNTAANVSDAPITVVSPSTFSIDGVAGNGAYTSGGTWTVGRPALYIETNRDGIGSYRPLQVFARYQTESPAPFEVNYQGISSAVNYGELGGTPSGTATASEHFINVHTCAHNDTEYGGVRVGIDMDPDNGNFPTTTPGRAWTIDSTLVGPRLNPPALLMGVVQLIQQQVSTTADSASKQPSAAFTATARSSSLESRATVPADVGYLCVGTSGAIGANTGAGYTIGFKVGGVAGGGGWLPYGQRSRILTGMQIEDYQNYGILLQNRIDAGTGQAISLGWVTAGVASTNVLDGIDFGGDVQLFRKGTGLVGTASSDGIAAGTLYVQGTGGAGNIQMTAQSSVPGTPSGTDEIRFYVANDANSQPSLFSIDDGGNIISLGKNWQFPATVTSQLTGRTIALGQTVTIGAAGGIRGLNMQGTFNIGSGDPNSTSFIVFAGHPTINLTTTTSDLNDMRMYSAAPAISVDAGIAAGNVGGTTYAFFAAPNFTQGAGGTATLPGFVGLSVGPSFGTGWITTGAGEVVGVQFAPTQTTPGNVKNYVGVDITDLDAATLNLSLRSAGSAVQMRHHGPGVFGANAAPTAGSVALEVQSTTAAFLPSRMTTTERDAMTEVVGMVIWNLTTTKLEVCTATGSPGTWAALH